MDEATALEFRNQLLGKFIKPLVGEIVSTHQRGLAEADSLHLNNHWVERSRQKIMMTQNILARQYADLSWRALSQYKADIAEYKAAVNSGDVRSLELRDEMANLIDFSRSFAKAAIEAYGVTFARAAAIKAGGSELRKTEDAAFSFGYRFATTLDSLAKVANDERRAYDALVKQRRLPPGHSRTGNARTNADGKGEDWQDAVIAFEDNSYSLSEGKTEVLQLGFELSQKHQLENAWSERIVLLLVKSEPEKYAGLLGLQVAQLALPTDETWLVNATYQAGWTEASFSAADWQPAQNFGASANFQGYGAQRLWLAGNGMASAAITLVDHVDSVRVDSTAVVPAPSPVVYFRKNFTVAGLPVSGQIQLLTDGSFNLFVNGEYVAQFNKLPNEKAAVQIKDLSNYLLAGENTIALEVRDTDNSGGVLEAVVFVKSVPGWEQRESRLRGKRERRIDLMIFERGILPNIY
jgi:hypothetical protein